MTAKSLAWTAVIFCLAGTASAQAQPGLLLYAPLDGSPTAQVAQGEKTAAVATGLKYLPGVRGEAVFIGEGASLAYHCPGNLNKSQGAIEFWLRADWPPEDHQLRVLLAEDAPNQSGSTMIRIWRNFWDAWTQNDFWRIRYEIRDQGGHYNVFDYDARGPGGYQINRMEVIGWKPGSWHHLIFTWDCQVGTRLYVDGKPAEERPYASPRQDFTFEPKSYPRIFIGSPRPGYEKTQGTANCAFDELRFYDRMLTTEEAKERYSSLVPIVFSLEPLMVKVQEPTQVQLTLTNRSPEGIEQGAVSYVIKDRNGRQISQGMTGGLTIKAGKKITKAIPLTLPRDGAYQLECRWEGDTRYRRELTLIAVGPLPKPAAEPLKLKLIDDINCAAHHGAERYVDDGTAKVVDSQVGKYREAGPGRQSRFAYRIKIGQPHTPHLIRVYYPDDKERTMLIDVSYPLRQTRWDVDTGVITGGVYPLTNKIQKIEVVFWPLVNDGAVLITSWEEGKPAAVSRIQIFEIEDGLSAAKVDPASDGGRMMGLMWEDASISIDLGGFDASPAEFHRTLVNLMDYLRYTGQNLTEYPVTFYQGPFYPSQVEDPDKEPRRMSHPGDWLEELLTLCDQNRVNFIAGLNHFGQLPSLKANTNTDIEKIIAGADTYNQMLYNNQVCGDGRGHPSIGSPLYNPLHPTVRSAFLAMIDEILERYAHHPSFKGLAIYLWADSCLWFGSLTSGYGDLTIRLFEKETKIKVPVSFKDPQRFEKRFAWLIKHRQEQWIEWRCQKVAQFVKEINRHLQKKRKDLILSIVCWMPYSTNDRAWHDLAAIEAGKTVGQIYREGGMDFKYLRGIPNVVLQRKLCPSDFRWRAGHQERLPEAFLSDSINFDPAVLATFQNPGRNAAFIYNRYFETRVWNPSRDLKTPSQGIPDFWWWGPFIANSVSPAGRNFLRYYAHALATYDVMFIGNGGSSIGTMGHDALTREWAQAFRALPAQPFSDVAGNTDPVVVRELKAKGKHYFYAVNRESYPVELTLTFSQAPKRLVELSSSTGLTPKGTILKLNLLPYQLRSFSASGTDLDIRSVQVKVPDHVATDLASRIAQAEKVAADRQAQGEDTAQYRSALTQAKTALADQRYYEARRILDDWVVRGQLLSPAAKEKRSIPPGRLLLNYELMTISRPWMGIGPFDNEKSKGLDAVYPPEQEIDFAESYRGKGDKQVRWQKVSDRGQYLDFEDLYHDDWAVAYAFTKVHSPQPRKAQLLIGSDDGVKVWLNGELVHQFIGARGSVPGNDVVDVELKAGWNSLLVKVEERIGGWGFHLTIADQRANPLTDLKFSP